MRAAFVASCLRGALPPVLLRAVCLVRAIVLGVVLLYGECCCVLAESGWRIDRPGAWRRVGVDISGPGLGRLLRN